MFDDFPHFGLLFFEQVSLRCRKSVGCVCWNEVRPGHLRFGTDIGALSVCWVWLVLGLVIGGFFASSSCICCLCCTGACVYRSGRVAVVKTGTLA